MQIITHHYLLPLGSFAFINLLLTGLGFYLVKQRLVWLSWVLVISGIAVIILAFYNWPAYLKMLAVIATTFTGMKLITVTAEYRGKTFNLSFTQWAAFCSGWAGMRAAPFTTLGHAALPFAKSKIAFGISRLIAGIACLTVAHSFKLLNWPAAPTLLLTSVAALVGLSLILHFGLLSISAGVWRLLGVNVSLLFNKPAKSLSLTEFWGKRWNVAFIEMSALVVFRPLKKIAGKPIALVASFIFSGLLHELALSLPVNGGYGLPTLYFALQGTVVLAENYLITNKCPCFKNKWFLRAWTMFWIIIPSPLLFHQAFIQKVVFIIAGL